MMPRVHAYLLTLLATAICLNARPGPLRADEPTDPNAVTASADAPKLPAPEGAKRLSPQFDVWLDMKGKAVIVDGEVCLRRGMLEMFACTRNTKEHEAVVSANTQAFLVHSGLLALGAEPGHVAQWVPEFKPATGTEIDVTVQWLDNAGKQHSARAQDWIRNLQTGRAMDQPWVFAGSRFWTDEETGRQYYQAEGGDFICVSNFSTAMLDIPIESSQSNEELAFEAFTEHIPPVRTPIRLVLKPKLKEKPAAGGDRGTRPADAQQPPAE